MSEVFCLGEWQLSWLAPLLADGTNRERLMPRVTDSLADALRE